METMTNRQRTTAIKKEVREKYPDLKLKVRWGRGTAHRWVSLYASDVSGDVREELEKIAAKYAGSYYTDYGPGLDDWASCVSIDPYDRAP